jgi:hypothetical protein
LEQKTAMTATLGTASERRPAKLHRNRYHLPMRVLLITLLIVLLPIRGWSAERMAVYMAGASVQSAMPDDCPMKMGASSTEQRLDERATDSGHKSDRSCQACQLCMAFAAQETPVLTTPASEAVSHAVPLADRFASVDPARLAKPPIC